YRCNGGCEDRARIPGLLDKELHPHRGPVPKALEFFGMQSVINFAREEPCEFRNLDIAIADDPALRERHDLLTNKKNIACLNVWPHIFLEHLHEIILLGNFLGFNRQAQIDPSTRLDLKRPTPIWFKHSLRVHTRPGKKSTRIWRRGTPSSPRVF